VRYIIDVTQLVHWSGNLTGIPRVMDELAIRFLNTYPDNTVFVSWVKEVGAMCEVNFAKTRTHRGSSIDYIYEGLSKVSSVRDNKSRDIAKKIIKKIAAKSRVDRSYLFQKLKSTSYAVEASTYKKYQPQGGDKFFIPWGEWWDQNWLNTVTSYSKNGVEIYPVCHDILPMVVPQFSGSSSSLSDFISQIFPISRKIIVQSRSTKNDLINWMESQQLTIPPVELFRIGEDFSTAETSVSTQLMTKKYSVADNKYLIYVSTIEPRKNHILLYYTYRLAKSRGIKLPKLLIVGRVGHDTQNIIKFINEDPEINDLIKIYNDVGDRDLSWLYDHCMFTVVPSLYEGWGMSVVESIAKGKPAVCSNSSSLAEMPENSVMHFNPNSTDECLDAIINMMKPDTLRRFTENAKKYVPHSWDSSFNQIIDILGK